MEQINGLDGSFDPFEVVSPAKFVHTVQTLFHYLHKL